MALEKDLEKLLAQYGMKAVPADDAPKGGWAAPAAPATAIQGVAVPIKLMTPKGQLRCYISLPAEVAADPQTLMSALEGLANEGLPLDFWAPKKDWDRGGGGGGGGGGRGKGW